MSDSPANIPGSASRFFTNYLTRLAKAGVPDKQRRWYVKHIETFIRAQNGRKIKTLTATDITQYLDMLGRQKRLQGWHFVQRIDAIRIMYCDLLALPVGKEIEWDYWLDSAKQLDIDHPTIAPELTPEELTYLKARKGEGPVQQVRKDHRDLLIRLVSEIRRRRYAYRTEQSYEQWVCRYILFARTSLLNKLAPVK